MTLDLQQLFYALVVGGAIYGGIRVDLKWIKSTVERVEQRLDNHLGKGQ